MISEKEILHAPNGAWEKAIDRNAILTFEQALANHPEAMFGDNKEMPLTHKFAPGMYVREIFIPKGSVLTGKIHRHEHPNILMKGEVLVVTEYGGREHLKAPMSMISKAGTKRVVYALEDTVWITIHLNPENTTDLKKLEEYVIAPNYEALLPVAALEPEWSHLNCLIRALKSIGRDYRCLLELEPTGYLLPFKVAIEKLRENHVSIEGLEAYKQTDGVWHVEARDGATLEGWSLLDDDMVGSWVAVAIGGGAVLGAGASYLSADAQSSAANNASNAQLQAMLESIKAQKEMTQQGFSIFQQYTTQAQQFLKDQNALAIGQNEKAINELQPFKQLALQSLQRASDFTDPNSALSMQERAAFAKTLGQNLNARGLSGSGNEFAGLSDFELGLGRQRRDMSMSLANLGTGTLQSIAGLQQNIGGLQANLGQGLAGLSSNLGGVGSSLYGSLGQNIGATLGQGGMNQANMLIAQGQANAQGIAGMGNAIQGGLAGLGQLSIQQSNQDWLKSILGGIK